MSYARFGPDSDVYVYRTDENSLTCSMCKLADVEGKDPEGLDRSQMIEHLMKHQRAFHKVPDYCLERLKTELALNPQLPAWRRTGPVEAKLVDGVLTCGFCGDTEFFYDENIPTRRGMALNRNGRLVFHSHYEEFDGDDTPGVICAECETPATYPDSVELDWTA